MAAAAFRPSLMSVHFFLCVRVKAEARFESFVTKHGKTYRHAADKAFRKSIFHAHERFVDTHNHKVCVCVCVVRAGASPPAVHGELCVNPVYRQ